MSLSKERDAVIENGQIGIDTGWQSLNKYISGWVNPDLIILAARPAQGKTAFMLNAILNVLKQDKPVGIFSLEMSGEQLVNRLISLDSGIAHHLLRNNNLTEAHKFMLMASEDRLQKAKLYIDDTPSLNIDGPMIDGPMIDGPIIDGPIIDGPIINDTVLSVETETVVEEKESEN
jgi:replicative DNA helicase